MGGSTTQLILQIVGVAVGGTLVQLIIFLIKKRSDLRSINTTSDSTVVTTAELLMARLAKAEAAGRQEIDRLNRLLGTEQQNFTRAINAARGEINRLGAEVARLRTDHDISQARIRALTSRIGAPVDRSPRDAGETQQMPRYRPDGGP
jgi:chromosome segregation ATPase